MSLKMIVVEVIENWGLGAGVRMYMWRMVGDASHRIKCVFFSKPYIIIPETEAILENNNNPETGPHLLFVCNISETYSIFENLQLFLKRMYFLKVCNNPETNKPFQNALSSSRLKGTRSVQMCVCQNITRSYGFFRIGRNENPFTGTCFSTRRFTRNT